MNPLMYIRLIVMGIPAVIATFLYWQNHSLHADIVELNATLSIEKENIRTLKVNISKIQDAHDVTLKTVDQLKKDNNISKTLVRDLSMQNQSNTNLIDYLVKNVDKKDDKPATQTLKNAVIATKEAH